MDCQISTDTGETPLDSVLAARLESTPVVPLLEADEPAVAIDVARALAAGGLGVIEVVLRTPRALDCLAAVAAELPEVVAGAGTVLDATQVQAALAHRAAFIVSPGLDEGVVEASRKAGVPVFPGVATAGEVQRARNLGLRTVKFFPASVAGGVPALRALSGVFREMRFMPTGGISAANLADYLSVPAVVACGGSWLTPANAIRRGDFDSLTTLAREAVDIAASARPVPS